MEELNLLDLGYFNKNNKEDLNVLCTNDSEIIDLIKYGKYFKLGDKTTICFVQLVNGFEIVSTSACVNKEDYNEEIGKTYSFENVIKEIRKLEAYKKQEFRHTYMKD